MKRSGSLLSSQTHMETDSKQKDENKNNPAKT